MQIKLNFIISLLSLELKLVGLELLNWHYRMILLINFEWLTVKDTRIIFREKY